eukprot:130806-Chlamydomonas_euryale.AAC.5
MACAKSALSRPNHVMCHIRHAKAEPGTCEKARCAGAPAAGSRAELAVPFARGSPRSPDLGTLQVLAGLLDVRHLSRDGHLLSNVQHNNLEQRTGELPFPWRARKEGV